jgi:hypothetical protein
VRLSKFLHSILIGIDLILRRRTVADLSARIGRFPTEAGFPGPAGCVTIM